MFVTIGGGIEGLVHISELTYGHVANVDRLAKVGQNMIVRIIGFEDGKISLSAKQLKDDPWSIIPKKFKVEIEVKSFVLMLRSQYLYLTRWVQYHPLVRPLAQHQDSVYLRWS